MTQDDQVIEVTDASYGANPRPGFECSVVRAQSMAQFENPGKRSLVVVEMDYSKASKS